MLTSTKSVLGLTLFSLLLGSSLAAQQPPKKFAMPVEAVPVKVQDYNVEVSATGSLEANEAVVIRPEIIGKITRIPFTEG